MDPFRLLVPSPAGLGALSVPHSTGAEGPDARSYADDMRTSLLTDPAIPGADEDAAGVLGPAAVVCDGAGIPARYRRGCRHEVAWYSHLLTAHLLRRLQDPGLDLREALRRAIADVSAEHEGTCDLAAGGPSATVVAVREEAREEGRVLEHLVLADSSLLLDLRGGGTRRVTDDRVERAARTAGSADALEALRNAPGGFWVARHETEAADEALCGSTPIEQLRAAHLVSDGATRPADLLGTRTDASLTAALTQDPAAVLRDLRAAERALPTRRAPRKRHDDATVVSLRWEGREGQAEPSRGCAEDRVEHGGE